MLTQINSVLLSCNSIFGVLEGLEKEVVEKRKDKVVAPWSPWAGAVVERTAEPSEAVAPLMVEEEEAGQTDLVVG